MAEVQADTQAVIAAMEQGTPASDPSPQPAEVAQVQTPEPQGDAFTQLDPNTLDPALLPIYKSLQADYTRKTQEVAGVRKQLEQYGDFDSVKQKLEFYDRFDSDPQYAKQVLDQLSPRLQELLGVSDAPVEPEPSLDEYDLPPELTQKLSKYDQKFQELEQEKEAMALAHSLQRQEMAIRQTNPDYTDEDVNAIYDYLYITNGDLLKAEQHYNSLRTKILAGYVQSKQEVPAGVAPVQTNTPHAETPRTFNSIEDATAAAMEYARARTSGG
jgi:hypothetical protein